MIMELVFVKNSPEQKKMHKLFTDKRKLSYRLYDVSQET